MDVDLSRSLLMAGEKHIDGTADEKQIGQDDSGTTTPIEDGEVCAMEG